VQFLTSSSHHPGWYAHLQGLLEGVAVPCVFCLNASTKFWNGITFLDVLQTPCFIRLLHMI
jgi:hypothetical protein